MEDANTGPSPQHLSRCTPGRDMAAPRRCARLPPSRHGTYPCYGRRAELLDEALCEAAIRAFSPSAAQEPTVS